MAPTPELPFPDTWWIEDGAVLGGGFPGHPDHEQARRRAISLLELDVRLVVNLQERAEDGREGSVPYEGLLLATARRRGRRLQLVHEPVQEHDAPTPEQARRIMDRIDATLAEGGRVYLHSWSGRGRTAAVAEHLHRRRNRNDATQGLAVR